MADEFGNRMKVYEAVWDIKLPARWQYGTSIYRKTKEDHLSNILTKDEIEKLKNKNIETDKILTRDYWFVDTETPKFSENKTFIERFLDKKESQ